MQTPNHLKLYMSVPKVWAVRSILRETRIIFTDAKIISQSTQRHFKFLDGAWMDQSLALFTVRTEIIFIEDVVQQFYQWILILSRLLAWGSISKTKISSITISAS